MFVKIQLKSIFFYLFCLQLIQVNGQQEVIFSQYMFNHQSLNPGYAGSKEYTNFTILHRSQWLNFDGAPESQAFTFNHKMTSKNIGFGLSGVNDKIGPMTSSRVALDLAYHLALEKAFLSIGIKLGVVNYDFDQSIIRTTDVGDNSFVFDGEGEFKSNIGFGMYYHRAKWYAGLSIPWFIENESFNIQRHYYGIFGCIINLSEGLKLKPSLLVKHTTGAPYGYDFSTIMFFKDTFWIGPQLRSTFTGVLPRSKFGGGFGIIAGIHLNKTVSLGYSFNTSSLGKYINVNHSTHELMMRFDLIPTVKNILRSPRIF